MRICPECRKHYNESKLDRCPRCHTATPTLEEIAAGCLAVQATWTCTRERKARYGGYGELSEPHVETQVIARHPCGRRVMRDAERD